MPTMGKIDETVLTGQWQSRKKKEMERSELAPLGFGQVVRSLNSQSVSQKAFEGEQSEHITMEDRFFWLKHAIKMPWLLLTLAPFKLVATKVKNVCEVEFK